MTSHTRITTNAEEIAFYNGAELEKSIVNRTYLNLVKHLNKVLQIRILYNTKEDFIIKYSWSAVGLLIASIPVFFPEYSGARTRKIEKQMELLEKDTPKDDAGAFDRKTGSRTQSFITNKRFSFFH